MTAHVVILAVASSSLFAQGPGLAETSFLQKAASNGKAEVTAAQLGAAKATLPALKLFAQRLVEDHGKLNAIVQQLAMQKGVPLDFNALAATDDLGELRGTEFDQAFVQYVIKGHERTIADFEQQQKTIRDRDILNFISSALPILQMHLNDAKALVTTEKTDGAALPELPKKQIR